MKAIGQTFILLLITTGFAVVPSPPNSQPDTSQQQTAPSKLGSESAALRPPAPAVETAKATTAEAPRAKSIIWERWNVVIAALQTVALVITFAVMIYVGIRQLRAYVSVTCKFIHAFDHANWTGAQCELKNCGLTPAQNVRTTAYVDVFPHPLPTGFQFPALGDVGARTSLFPGAVVTSRIGARALFSQSEIADIRAGTKRIFVWGVTYYSDVFRLKRRTYFGATVVADAATLLNLTSNYKPADLAITFEHVSELNTVK